MHQPQQFERAIPMPEGQLRALLDYLITRPYSEVANAVSWIQLALDAKQQQAQEAE